MSIQTGRASRLSDWIWYGVLALVTFTLGWSGLAIWSAQRGGSAADGVSASESVGLPPDLPALPLEAPQESQGAYASGIVASIAGITDAAVGSEHWYILDRRARRVHVLTKEGEVVRAFGREGRGPGEFAFPEALAIHGDTVVVAEMQGGVIHLFDPGGEHLGDRRIDRFARLGPGVMGVESSDQGLVFLVVCPDPPRGLEARAVLERLDGCTIELGARKNTTDGRGTIDVSFLPPMAVQNDAVLFGLTADPCLALNDFSGGATGELCHDWLPQLPLSPEMQEEVDQMMERGSGRGLGWSFRVLCRGWSESSSDPPAGCPYDPPAIYTGKRIDPNVEFPPRPESRHPRSQYLTSTAYQNGAEPLFIIIT